MGCGQSTPGQPRDGFPSDGFPPGTAPGSSTTTTTKHHDASPPTKGGSGGRNKVHPEPSTSRSIAGGGGGGGGVGGGSRGQPSNILLQPPSIHQACKTWQAVRAELQARGLLLSVKEAVRQQGSQQPGPVGCSPAFLSQLAEVIGPGVTAADVVDHVILPALDEYGCSRFCDLIALDHVAPAQFLTSYSRSSPLADTLQAVAHHVAITAASGLRAASSWPPVASSSVWVDLLCSQHLRGQQQDASAALEEVHEVCIRTRATLLVLADTSAQGLSRLWVITEILKTFASDTGNLAAGGALQLVGAPSYCPAAGPAAGPAASGTGPAGAAAGSQLVSLQLAGAAQPSLTSRALLGALGVCNRPGDLQVSRPADRPALLSSLESQGADIHTPGELHEEVAAALQAAAEHQADTLLQLCTGYQGPSAGPAGGGPVGALARGGGGGGGGDSMRSSVGNSKDDVQVRGSKQIRTSGGSPPAITDPASSSASTPVVVVSVEAEAAGALRAADALMVAGALLHAVKAWNYAEAALRRALQLRGRVLGGDCLPTARATLALGCLLSDAGHEEEAEPLLRKGITRAKKALGKEHGEVGDALSHLGQLLVRGGKVEEAEAALKNALRVQAAAWGHVDTRTIATGAHLAAALRDSGKLPDALNLYRSVMDAQGKLYGSLHPHVATTAGNLAYLLQQQGEPEQALPLAKQALQGMEAAYGGDSPMTAAAKANLGNLYHALGRDREAYDTLQDALDSLARTRGEQHHDTVTARAALAQLEKHMMNNKPGSPSKIKGRS